MPAFCTLALLATLGHAQQNPSHEHLIPDFPATGNPEYDKYLVLLDRIDDLVPETRPTNQLDAGMAGLYDPEGQVGEVLTYPLLDSDNHFAEHWFFHGPFVWDAEMDVEMEPPGIAIHGSYVFDPYIYMDIRYRAVPPAWATEDLTLVDPTLIERAYFVAHQDDGAGGTVPTAWLTRELHHHVAGDRYVDHWLFDQPALLLTSAGDAMELRLDPTPYDHTAAWFDVYRPGSMMYAKIKHEELTGAAY